MIVPTNVGRVVEALVRQFKEDFELSKLQPTIERSGRNEDPDACPWISVYRFGVQYPPRAMGGGGGGFRYQNIQLAVVCQASSPNSGEDCEKSLENLLERTVAAILSDHTLRGTVQMLDEEFDVQYPDYQLNQGVYMQTAIIQFTAVTTVGG